MIVAGIGFARHCQSDDLLNAMRRAATAAPDAIQAIAVPAFKRDDPLPAEIAARLRLPLIVVPEAALAAAQPRCMTCSPRAAKATGLASVAEAAALAAAGPHATLLVPRTVSGLATCAIAGSPSAGPAPP